ncbi:MFS general substrate transporter [Xylariaceae sp. FL0804]|nr:MFS general substrate transporter [Xylariaceae sp. FL0804]
MGSVHRARHTTGRQPPSSSSSSLPPLPPDIVLVGWHNSSDSGSVIPDPANPQNWPLRKKLWVTCVISLYTFAVYIGSSLWAPAESSVRARFGASRVGAELGLALYVVGYGVGPLIWSPLSEIPRLGRTSIYVATFGAFVALALAAGLLPNPPNPPVGDDHHSRAAAEDRRELAALLALRFLLGFFGSPCLATAGATLDDMFAPWKLGYVLPAWSMSATMGPALGPILAGYAVEAGGGWRVAQWELFLLAAPIWLLMLVGLPETNPDTILHRRAARVRARYEEQTRQDEAVQQRRRRSRAAATPGSSSSSMHGASGGVGVGGGGSSSSGDEGGGGGVGGRVRIMCAADVKHQHMTWAQIAWDALVKPWQINALDPAVLYTTLYSAIIYATYYSFFEAFPLVFTDMYGFGLGASGLPFLAFIPALSLALPSYVLWFWYRVEPVMRREPAPLYGWPESRLMPAVLASFVAPVSLFLFAWTSNPRIHYMVPITALFVFFICIFFIYQCMFLYLSRTYPKYSASLFAANDFARSMLAAAAILFARPMYTVLGVGGGVSLLGGLSLLCAGGMLYLYLRGHQLRARSRFAQT